MPNIITKRDFVKLTPKERIRAIEDAGLTLEYFCERHLKVRKTTRTVPNMSHGINNNNRTMLDFIALEFELYQLKKLKKQAA